MAIQKLVPYLNYDGRAAEAVDCYQNHLGARVESLMHFRDGAGQIEFPPEAADRIMHASLRVGEAELMLSDIPPGHGLAPGNDVHLSLQFDDLDEMLRCFEALAGDDGQVTMSLHETFWGAKFGMLTDKFGVHWMFSATQPK